MLEDLSTELKRRQLTLNLERADILAKVQAWLDSHYPGQARAVSLNHHTLLIAALSAPVASEIRLSQVAIKSHEDSIERIKIMVTS